MQYLSPDEARSLVLKNKGLVKSANPTTIRLYKYLDDTNVGEAFKIERTEWDLKSEPASSITNYRHTHKLRFFSCRQLADGSGWLVTRLK